MKSLPLNFASAFSKLPAKYKSLSTGLPAFLTMYSYESTFPDVKISGLKSSINEILCFVTKSPFLSTSRLLIDLVYPVVSSHILASSSIVPKEDILTSRSLPFKDTLSSFILLSERTLLSFSSRDFASSSLKDSLKTTVISLFILPVGVISTICLYLLTFGKIFTSSFISKVEL